MREIQLCGRVCNYDILCRIFILMKPLIQLYKILTHPDTILRVLVDLFFISLTSVILWVLGISFNPNLFIAVFTVGSFSGGVAEMILKKGNISKKEKPTKEEFKYYNTNSTEEPVFEGEVKHWAKGAGYFIRLKPGPTDPQV